MTNRDRVTAQQRALAALSELALVAEDGDVLLGGTCRLLGRELGIARIRISGPQGESRAWIEADAADASSEPPYHEPPVLGAEPHGAATASREVVGLAARSSASPPPDAIAVPIRLPRGDRWGVIEVAGWSRSDFEEADVRFLSSVAAILGLMIDRLRMVDEARRTEVSGERAMTELRHRVRNDIAAILGVVRLRERRTGSAVAREELGAVADCVRAILLVQDRLVSARDGGRLALGPFLHQLLADVMRAHDAAARGVSGEVRADEVELEADRAVALGLVLVEFATNSLKHAFGDGGGLVGVHIEARVDGDLGVRMTDDGWGLPPADGDGGPAPDPGLGMRLIEGLAAQLDTTAAWSRPPRGVALELRVPSSPGGR